MTVLREIEWEAPLIEPYRDPDAEALMRKKYGFVMDSVAFYGRSPWIIRKMADRARSFAFRRGEGRAKMKRTALLAAVLCLVLSREAASVVNCVPETGRPTGATSSG
jgi:hypothetical protein